MVLTDVDLSGSTILIDDTNYKGFYKIGNNDVSWQELVLTEEQKVELIKDSSMFPLLEKSVPHNSLIKLEENRFDEDNNIIQNKTELLVYNAMGKCLNTLSDNWIEVGNNTTDKYTSEFKTYYQPFTTKQTIFNGCEVKISISPNLDSQNINCFEISTNNVIVKNFTVLCTLKSVESITNQSFYCIFSFADSYNITFENVSFYFDTKTTDVEIEPFLCLTNFQCCSDITIDNSNFNIESNISLVINLWITNSKTVYITNSNISYMINEYTKDVFIDNSVFCSSQDLRPLIHLNHIYGTLSINNSIFNITSDRYTTCLFYCISVFGFLCNQVVLNNIKIDVSHPINDSHLHIIEYFFTCDNSTNNPYVLPEFRLNNIDINTSIKDVRYLAFSTANIDVSMLTTVNNFILADFNNITVYPSNNVRFVDIQDNLKVDDIVNKYNDKSIVSFRNCIPLYINLGKWLCGDKLIPEIVESNVIKPKNINILVNVKNQITDEDIMQQCCSIITPPFDYIFDLNSILYDEAGNNIFSTDNVIFYDISITNNSNISISSRNDNELILEFKEKQYFYEFDIDINIELKQKYVFDNILSGTKVKECTIHFVKSRPQPYWYIYIAPSYLINYDYYVYSDYLGKYFGNDDPSINLIDESLSYPLYLYYIEKTCPHGDKYNNDQSMLTFIGSFKREEGELPGLYKIIENTIQIDKYPTDFLPEYYLLIMPFFYYDNDDTPYFIIQPKFEIIDVNASEQNPIFVESGSDIDLEYSITIKITPGTKYLYINNGQPYLIINQYYSDSYRYWFSDITYDDSYVYAILKISSSSCPIYPPTIHSLKSRDNLYNDNCKTPYVIDLNKGEIELPLNIIPRFKYTYYELQISDNINVNYPYNKIIFNVHFMIDERKYYIDKPLQYIINPETNELLGSISIVSTEYSNNSYEILSSSDDSIDLKLTFNNCTLSYEDGASQIINFGDIVITDKYDNSVSIPLNNVQVTLEPAEPATK